MTRKKLVLASRTSLVMLLVAAVALLALGVVALLRVDAPEAEGWLRSLFGRVFGVAAMGLAAVLGIPAALGLWTMAGATADQAEPALWRPVRLALVGTAVATTLVTAVVVLTTGASRLALDLGLIALVALASFGLAGAAAASPHRIRATSTGFAVLAIATGTLWVLARAMDLRRL